MSESIKTKADILFAPFDSSVFQKEVASTSFCSPDRGMQGNRAIFMDYMGPPYNRRCGIKCQQNPIAQSKDFERTGPGPEKQKRISAKSLKSFVISGDPAGNRTPVSGAREL